MDAPQSNLTLVLLITANLIPIVNRILGYFDNKKNTETIVMKTAAQSTVNRIDGKSDTTIGKLSNQDDELAELKRMVLSMYTESESKKMKQSAYVPIDPSK
jgi:hypothetical protein